NNGSVKHIQSQVALIGQGTNSTVVVDDSHAKTQDRVTISNGPTGDVLVGEAALDNLFAQGGGLDCTGMSALTANLSKGADDTVQLTPSVTTAFFLNGNLAEYQSGHGALLKLIGATTPQFTATGPRAGKWTFGGNQQPVSFT